MKKDKNFLIVHCALCSLTCFDDCSFLFPNTYINNDSIWVFKFHILSRDDFFAFDFLQSKKVTNTQIVILAVATIWVVLLDVVCSCVRDF